MNGRYILDDEWNPVPEPDLMKWAQWFETSSKRRIALTNFGDVEISTVFLGLDHRFGAGAAPLLFETMVFGGAHEGHCDRYSTQPEALKGHNDIVRMVCESLEAKA